MEQAILITNAFSFCLAYIILVKRFLNDKVYKISFLFFGAFILEVIFNFFLIEYSKISFYLSILIISLVINTEQKDKIKSLNYAVVSLYYLQVFVMLLGSVIYFLTSGKELTNQLGYNVIMQIGIISFSIMIDKVNGVAIGISKSEDALILNLIYNILFLVFLNYVMSFLYIKIGMEAYYLISLVFILFDIFNKAFIKIIDKKDMDILIKRYELELMKVKSQKIEDGQQEINRIKDSTRAIIKELLIYFNQDDIVGLKKYFANRISPIYLKFLYGRSKMVEVEQINHPIIKSLILEFIDKLAERDIKVSLDIKKNFNIPESNQLEVYKAVEVFLEDAYQELMMQDQGNVQMKIKNEKRLFEFSMISSTISRATLTESVYSKAFNNLVQVLRSKKNILKLYSVKDSGFFCQGIVVRNNK